MIPASSPGLTSSSSTLEAALLGPAHLHPQHHLGPVLRVGAAGAGVDRDERVAGVVGAGEQPLLLEREQPLLDRGQRAVELARELLVLLRQLDQRLEVLDVGLDAAEGLEPPRHARVLGADLRRRLGVIPERPARPSAVSSAATRSASEAGSKIVREQRELVADRRETRRRRLR